MKATTDHPCPKVPDGTPPPRRVVRIRDVTELLRRETVRRRVRIAVFSLFGVLAIVLGAVFVQTFLANREFDAIRDLVPTRGPDDPIAEPTPGADMLPVEGNPWETFLWTKVPLTPDGILPEYASLHAENPDLAGWIRYPGWDAAPIDYPIMHSGDNDYYIRKDFYKRYSLSGSIFMDGSGTPLELDRNIVLYGHAMKSKTMFGNLSDFPKNPKANATHRIIYVDLLWTRLEYEVFSTYYIPSDGDYRVVRFYDDEDFLSYATMLKERSTFDFGVDVGPQDCILTLSTCEAGDRNQRVAIHAKLVRQILFVRPEPTPEALPTAPS